jgi:hypothetical protein
MSCANRKSAMQRDLIDFLSVSLSDIPVCAQSFIFSVDRESSTGRYSCSVARHWYAVRLNMLMFPSEGWRKHALLSPGRLGAFGKRTMLNFGRRLPGAPTRPAKSRGLQACWGESVVSWSIVVVYQAAICRQRLMLEKFDRAIAHAGLEVRSMLDQMSKSYVLFIASR